MDPTGHYPEPLEEAFRHGAQRAAQLAAIVTAAAQVYAQCRAHHERRQAARDEQAARALRDQERAAYRQARLGWAPAHDPRWLAQANLLQAATVWGAAVPYAGADPVAAAALRKCEDRLRTLHPYAMARYDRLRGDGLGPIETMREAVPLFAREPRVRTGEPAGEHPALDITAGEPDAGSLAGIDDGPVLESGTDLDDAAEQRGREIVERLQSRARASGRPDLSADELVIVLETVTNLPGEVIGKLARAKHEDAVAVSFERARSSELGRAVDVPVTRPVDDRTEGLTAARHASGTAETASAHAAADRTAAQLAAESFPYTAADAVAAAAAGGPANAALTRAPTATVQQRRQPGRSV